MKHLMRFIIHFIQLKKNFFDFNQEIEKRLQVYLALTSIFSIIYKRKRHFFKYFCTNLTQKLRFYNTHLSFQHKGKFFHQHDMTKANTNSRHILMIQIYDTDNSIAGSRHRAKALCKS